MKPKPRNGSHFTALLVGGDKLLRNKLIVRMAQRGVHIAQTWEPARHLEQKAIPTDIDIVFIPRDQSLSRNSRDKIAFNARKVAYVVDVTTVSYAEQKLEQSGYVGDAIDLQALKDKKREDRREEVARLARARAEDVSTSHTAYGAEPEPSEPPLFNDAEQPAPPAEEESVSEQSVEERMRAAGKLVWRARDAKKMSAPQVGKLVGCSGGNILAIEKGKARPSNAMCVSVERVLDLPPGTIPRLAKRENHRLGLPIVAEPAPLPPPVVPPPTADTPPPLKPVEIKQPEPVPAASPRVQLMLQLAGIQERLAGLGIKSVQITPQNLNIQHEDEAR
jgi:transcriptional regulator with XRE-family HTH domain